MTVYAFRAELQSDIDALHQALKARQIKCVMEAGRKENFRICR